MKKYLSIMVLVFVLIFSTTVFGSSDWDIEVKGEKLSISSDLGSPFLDNGTTYIPLRAIGEALGYEIDWKDGIVLIDGKDIGIKEKSIIIDERTYVPLRFLAEEMSHKVDYSYDDNTHRIKILDKGTYEKEIELKAITRKEWLDLVQGYADVDNPDIQAILRKHLGEDWQSYESNSTFTSGHRNMILFGGEGDKTHKDWLPDYSNKVIGIWVDGHVEEPELGVIRFYNISANQGDLDYPGEIPKEYLGLVEHQTIAGKASAEILDYFIGEKDSIKKIQSMFMDPNNSGETQLRYPGTNIIIGKEPMQGYYLKYDLRAAE